MGNCYIVRRGNISNGDHDNLPTGYTRLSYVLCPSTTQTAGFNLPIPIPSGSIIISETSCLNVDSDEAAIYGYSGSCELYYSLGDVAAYSNIRMLEKNLTVIPNIVKVKANTDIPQINIGYYRSGLYVFNGRLYSFKAAKLSTDLTVDIFINLIPAKRNSDNAIGLYELVTDTFYVSTSEIDFESDE